MEVENKTKQKTQRRFRYWHYHVDFKITIITMLKIKENKMDNFIRKL